MAAHLWPAGHFDLPNVISFLLLFLVIASVPVSDFTARGNPYILPRGDLSEKMIQNQNSPPESR